MDSGIWQIVPAVAAFNTLYFPLLSATIRLLFGHFCFMQGEQPSKWAQGPLLSLTFCNNYAYEVATALCTTWVWRGLWQQNRLRRRLDMKFPRLPFFGVLMLADFYYFLFFFRCCWVGISNVLFVSTTITFFSTHLLAYDRRAPFKKFRKMQLKPAFKNLVV